MNSSAQGSCHYCKLSDVKPDAAFDWTDAAQYKQGERFCAAGWILLLRASESTPFNVGR